jgi:hypothetical protein
MYNIYEIVDHICTKVKYSIKCEEAATRILASLEHQKWAQRDFNNTEYMRQAIRDRRRLRSCAAILDLFGASWEIASYVDVIASDRRGSYDWDGHNNRVADLEMLLDTNRMVSSTYSQIRRFIEDNRSRILDVEPKELEEFVSPRKHSVWLACGDLGGYLGRHSAEAVIEWKLVRRYSGA